MAKEYLNTISKNNISLCSGKIAANCAECYKMLHTKSKIDTYHFTIQGKWNVKQLLRNQQKGRRRK